MSNSELMDVIKYTEYIKKQSELYADFGENSFEQEEYISARKKLDENLKILKDNYVDYLLTVIDNYPIEMVFTITDMLYNYNYDIFVKLLEKNNEKIMRAFMMIKTINGDNPLEIKNNLSKVKNSLKENIISRRLNKERQEKVYNRESKEYELLNKYLKNINDKDVEKLSKRGLQTLFLNLHNVDKALFDNSSRFYNKSIIINYLFNKSELDLKVIDKIYNDVLLKNESLISFDYNPIIMSDSKFIQNIKGLFRKCNNDYFKSFSNQLITNEKCKKINQMLQDVVRINNNDEIGLGWFFIQFNMNASSKLKKYLNQFDYYNKYSNVDIKGMYDGVIDKLLNNDANDINPTIIETIGLYNGFIDKYDIFLDLFNNSKDSKYQDLLLIPLTTGLIEKKKKEYGLDFKVVLTNRDINNREFGSYNNFENILFINQHILKQYSDKKEAFANSVTTIFHEIRHAKQFKEIEKKLTLRNDSVISSIDAVAHLALPIHREKKNSNIHISFDNLLMAMDSAMNILNPRYYKHNYQNISYERDARKAAYVESMEFFKDREDMKKYLKEEEDISLSSSIMREDPDSHDASTFRVGIIDLFVKYCNEKMKVGKIGSIIEIFTKYPILSRFFTIRIHSNEVVPRDEKHFDKVLKEIDKNPNLSKKKEALYAVKMFNYAIRMQSYLSNYNFMSIDDESIETKLGPKPKK